MNGCHVEKPSLSASRKPAICLICAFSSFSSKVFKLEMTGFQSEKAVDESGNFESGNFSSEFWKVVVLQKLFLPLQLWSISVSFSSSSEK